MGKVITFMTEKGGVGKTTSAVAFCYLMAKKGFKVLLIDFDSQGNATKLYGKIPDDIDFTINELMMSYLQTDVIPKTNDFILCEKEKFSLIPANERLASLSGNLLQVDFREHKLKEVIESFKENYDYVVIDCSPSISVANTNALYASDEVVIPCNPDGFAVDAFTQLYKHYNLVKKRGNPNVNIAGVLFTKFMKNTKVSKGTKELLQKHFGDNFTIYETNIPLCVKVDESTHAQKSVNEYDPKCSASIAYCDWVEEFLKKERK